MEPEGLADRWADSLKTARSLAGLTQAELASRAGMSQPELSRFERGDRLPTDRVKLALAEALGTTVEGLFPFTAPERAAS